MEPSLQRGWTVRVRPLEQEPVPGDVLLFRSEGQLLVHRIVFAGSWRGLARLLHVGDAGGRVGMTGRENALGLVVGVVHPEGQPSLTLDQLDRRTMRRFAWARLRGHVYARLCQAVDVAGVPSWRPVRALGWAVRQILL
jgi:hypothetical protein